MVHNCLNGQAPQYLTDFCHSLFAVTSRQRLRSASRQLLDVPRYRLSSFARRAVSVAGPSAWNSLPEHLRDPAVGRNSFRQVALLLQMDRARHLSVEILQLQNISLENPIVWHYLRDSTFSRFDTIPECDRHTHTECMQTDRHTTMAYTALSIASRGKNRPYCTAHQL